MTTNVDRARQWFTDVWADGGEPLIDTLMAPDIHAYQEGGDITRREQFVAVRRQLFDTFPDLAVTVEDIIGDGEKVVVRWRVDATHTGPGLGMPPTNRRVSFRGMTWLEFSDGRIVRGWDSWNLGKLLQTLSTVS